LKIRVPNIFEFLEWKPAEAEEKESIETVIRSCSEGILLFMIQSIRIYSGILLLFGILSDGERF